MLLKLKFQSRKRTLRTFVLGLYSYKILGTQMLTSFLDVQTTLSDIIYCCIDIIFFNFILVGLYLLCTYDQAVLT
jgi:hypothetical protein